MTTPATPRRQAKPFQVRNTHHELDGVKVPQGTPGAVRISVLTAKWYGYINGRPVPLRTDDYDLAVERLAVLRMEAGVGDKSSPDATLAAILSAKARREDLIAELGFDSPNDTRAARNRRREARQKHIAGFVYVLLAENGLVKIGQTADPPGRLHTFSFFPVQVWPIHLIHTDSMNWVELHLHEESGARPSVA